jgi:hypothetical protein
MISYILLSYIIIIYYYHYHKKAKRRGEKRDRWQFQEGNWLDRSLAIVKPAEENNRSTGADVAGTAS